MSSSQFNRQIKVTVVGAGIIGSAISYILAKRGASVTVLDRSTPGSGATSHSFAWINATAKLPVSYHNLNLRSLLMWDRFANSLGKDVGLRWGGQLEWADTEVGASELISRATQLHSWGYPCQIIDGDQMSRLEPSISAGRVTAAIYCELDGMVEPTMVAQACITAAAQHGATVMLETEVTGLTSKYSSTTVVANGKTIESDFIVLAGGVDSTQLAAMAEISIPQQESPGVVIRTSPIYQQLLSNVSVVYAPPLEPGRPEIHLRQSLDGAAIIGEGNQESLAKNDTQAHANELLARATEYVPALKFASAIPVPVGYRPMPIDGFPVIGAPSKTPNIYLALTHSGVTLAPLIAQMVAIEIMDGTQVEFLNAYRPGRFE